jgi:hypothetical protein
LADGLTRILLIDCAKYNLWTPEDEEKEFHPLVKEHYKEIFGENSLYLPIEELLVSQAGRGVMPDGFVIVFSEKPEMYVVEVELSSHDIDKHIVEQINRFARALKNPENRTKIADDLEDRIRSRPMDEAFVKQQIGKKDIHRFLSDLISPNLKIIIIIENKDDRLVEACEGLKAATIIRELKTFKREGAPTVHAHLIEPIYPLAEPSRLTTKMQAIEPETLTPVIGEIKKGDYVEIVLRTPSERRFALFHLSKNNRRFFPGFKVSFTLATDIGDIETRVTSAKQDTMIGDPDAGAYIQGGLRPWYDKHLEADVGRKIRFECLEPFKKYKLTVV